MRARPVGVVLAAALASGCIGEAPISDTGYVGTWSRGNERQWSTVYIDREGDPYRFRMGVRSDDGVRVVVCDEEGRCEERIRGVTNLVYQFWTRLDPDTGQLIVEYTVTPVNPESRSYRYVDELTVEDDGLTLRAETIEGDGVKFEEKGERPTRFFKKISNRVLPADAYVSARPEP